MEDTKQSSRSKLWVFLCIAAIAALVVFIVLFITTNNKLALANQAIEKRNQEIVEVKDENEKLHTKVSELEAECSSLTTQVEDLVKKTEELNNTIQKRDARIIELGGGPSTSAEETSMTAESYIKELESSNLPIQSYIVHDEETDPNDLIGRPVQYISKVNFADDRVPQYDDEEPGGGTIEVFKTTEDAKKRQEYVESVQEAVPLVGTQYMYLSADGLALLRIDSKLTPEQAEEYRDVFVSIQQ